MVMIAKQDSTLLTENRNKKEFRSGLLLAVLCSFSLFMEQRILVNFTIFTGFSDQVPVWSVRFILMCVFFYLFLVRGFSRKLIRFQVLLGLSLIAGLVGLDVMLVPIYLVKILWLIVNFTLIYFTSKNIKSEKTLLLSLIIPIIVFGTINAVIIWDMDHYTGHMIKTYTYIDIFFTLSDLPLSFCVGMLLLTANRRFWFFITALLFFSIYVFTVQRTGMLTVAICFFALRRFKVFFANNNIKFFTLIAFLTATLTIAYIEYGVYFMRSIGTGRGNIWGYWIINMFESVQNLLFGFGSITENPFLEIAKRGDKIFNWSTTRFTHSGFISLLVTGGLIRFSIFFVLVTMMFKGSPRNIISSSLFYGSLVMISTYSLNGFFTSDFYGFAFTLSFFCCSHGFTSKTMSAFVESSDNTHKAKQVIG
jgi:hypothetical protein